MDFKATDPDVETINRRIQRGNIDLQPDFQRGDVWTQSKQQRLIDSIIRGWHVPPIHLVDRGDGKFDVLDGQQRLTAIRNFIRGDFPVDGSIEPKDSAINELSGKRWGELPDTIQEAINGFSLRVFQLYNYEPNEPYELFFRLNQPTNLTEAEKRNAFVGAARNQIKLLSSEAQANGMDPATIGFSNSRMAYDEVLARFALTVESGSLSQKLTSSRITQRYRDSNPFPNEVLSEVTKSLYLVIDAILNPPSLSRIRLNKATLHTWLCIAFRAGQIGVEPGVVSEALRAIELSRTEKTNIHRFQPLPAKMMAAYSDRSTSRVLDVSSVILRDFCGWVAIDGLIKTSLSPIINRALDEWMGQSSGDVQVAEWLIEHHWGQLT